MRAAGWWLVCARSTQGPHRHPASLVYAIRCLPDAVSFDAARAVLPMQQPAYCRLQSFRPLLGMPLAVSDHGQRSRLVTPGSCQWSCRLRSTACARACDRRRAAPVIWGVSTRIQATTFNGRAVARTLRATRPRPVGSYLRNLVPPLIKRNMFCQLDISGAILYCLSAILGLADQVCVS